MKHQEFPGLGESCFSAALPSGLQLRVVPKRGFARKYAFLAVNFGSVDTAFVLNGEKHRVPDGIAHYLEHKMFDLPGQVRGIRRQPERLYELWHDGLLFLLYRTV